MITGKTKICMVIGDPIDHSLSPQMHNAGLKARKIDSELVFVAARVNVRNLADFVKGVKIMGIRGVSATLPHKIEIINFLDKVDETAKKIGACNTIVNDDEVLSGYNTDWLGVIKPLEKIIDLKDKKVALIGAGGAARAAAYAFYQHKAKLTIFNRSLEKAEELAFKFKGEGRSLWDIVHVKEADVIFNATSVGMNNNETLIPKEFISKNQIVMDAIYTPYKTKLLQDAESKGAIIIPGLEILLEQGVEQFKLFTGLEAPIEAMRKALQECLL